MANMTQFNSTEQASETRDACYIMGAYFLEVVCSAYCALLHSLCPSFSAWQKYKSQGRSNSPSLPNQIGGERGGGHTWAQDHCRPLAAEYNTNSAT
jgi:hypothetical protein